MIGRTVNKHVRGYASVTLPRKKTAIPFLVVPVDVVITHSVVSHWTKLYVAKAKSLTVNG